MQEDYKSWALLYERGFLCQFILWVSLSSGEGMLTKQECLCGFKDLNVISDFSN